MIMTDNKQENLVIEKVSFKDTLNLPTTGFPIRPNAKQDDPEMIDSVLSFCRTVLFSEMFLYSLRVLSLEL